MLSTLTFVVILLLGTIVLTNALRGDWKDFIDPEAFSQYFGKEHSFFNTTLFQGDISNVDEDLSAEELSGFAGNAVKDEKLRWPDNTVPYTISPKFEEHQVEFIKTAMAAMNELTDNCIKFVERTNQVDYVKFVSGIGGCYSAIGRQGGDQKISLARGCLEDLGDTQHEIMHALGFFHEISRADRDQYVEINWNNIFEAQRRQFETFDGTTFGLPYDYASIMHYPYNAFAKDSKYPTILPTQRGAFIGQNKNVSALDQQRIMIAYGCPMSIRRLSQGSRTTKAPKLTKTVLKAKVTTLATTLVTEVTKETGLLETTTTGQTIVPTRVISRCENDKVTIRNTQTISRTYYLNAIDTSFTRTIRKSSFIRTTTDYGQLLTPISEMFPGKVSTVQTTTVELETIVLHTYYADQIENDGVTLRQEKFETRLWVC